MAEATGNDLLRGIPNRGVDCTRRVAHNDARIVSMKFSECA